MLQHQDLELKFGTWGPPKLAGQRLVLPTAGTGARGVGELLPFCITIIIFAVVLMLALEFPILLFLTHIWCRNSCSCPASSSSIPCFNLTIHSISQSLNRSAIQRTSSVRRRNVHARLRNVLGVLYVRHSIHPASPSSQRSRQHTRTRVLLFFATPSTVTPVSYNWQYMYKQ